MRDCPVQANNGRYGPYVLHNKVFVSLPKGTDPLTVTLEQAITFIEQKRKDDAPIQPMKVGVLPKARADLDPLSSGMGGLLTCQSNMTLMIFQKKISKNS